MARAVNRLTARSAETLGEGRHPDGGGLYIYVSASGARSWVYRWKKDGKRREMGLGSFPTISLKDARNEAAKASQLVAAGEDPIEVRDRKVAQQRSTPTFGEVADELMANLEPSFRSAKHRAQWRSTLLTYAEPLWKKPVDRISTDDVYKVLKPIWQTKASTASRLRGRIERVIDAALAQELRTDPNPARWRGHLDKLLAKRAKLQRGHHAAMAIDDLPSFMTRLADVPGIGARALEFTILTAARSGEVRGMTWGEIDLEAGIWKVPAERMKAGREHRVALSPAALAILSALPEPHTPAALVFPGQKLGRPMSDTTLAKVMERHAPGCTVHGFRSTFRDWVSDRTDFPRDLAESALAHVVGDATERAYRRGDAIEKRRVMMSDWAAFACSAPRNC